MTSGNILVTGGAGFIGSHTCKLLAKSGYVPVTLDDLSTGNRKSVKWGPFIKGSVHDRCLLEDTIQSHAVGSVIHFAGSAYVGESVDNPAKYYRNNIGGMISLLDASRNTGLDKLIFSSSCATYGIPSNLPISEQSEQKPINPYGWTKLICEQMIADHARAYGLRYVILRYYNACGADPDGELGEWHDPETHLIPLALRAATSDQHHLDIYGSDYPTSDGTCIRDYIHVCDLARAHISACEHLSENGDNLAVNLGTGKGLSVRDIVRTVGSVVGREVPVKYKSRRIGDPPVLYANPTRARSELGFTPKLSDIETIVTTAAIGLGLDSKLGPGLDPGLELADENQH